MARDPKRSARSRQARAERAADAADSTATADGSADGTADATDDGHVEPTRSATFGVGGLSDVGRVRDHNEDNWHWEPLDGTTALYAVADGMGGHDKGEVASAVAIESLFSAAREALGGLDERSVPTLRRLLRDAMQFANRSVVHRGEEQESNMGTTLCAALVHGTSDAFVANVGDSRAYLMRDGVLKQVSQDHSLVAYLVALGELTDQEARNHPSGNILVRSIGSVEEVEVDVFHVRVQAGDRLLLCSDGLWGEVEDLDLESILNANTHPQAACRALVDLANDHGGRDNTTLVVVNL